METALKRSGSCQSLTCDPGFLVAFRALSLVEMDCRRMAYNWINRNCELFCLYCTLGPRSGMQDFRTCKGRSSEQTSSLGVMKTIGHTALAVGVMSAAVNSLGTEYLISAGMAAVLKAAKERLNASAPSRGPPLIPTTPPPEVGTSQVEPRFNEAVLHLLVLHGLADVPDRLRGKKGVQWGDGSAALLCEMFVSNHDWNERE